LACLHSIQGNGGNNLQSQEYFAHAWPIRDDSRGNKENSSWIHGNILQQFHVNQRKSLPTSWTHTLRLHKVGSYMFPTLVPNFPCNSR
jgi:hypothetical protein